MNERLNQLLSQAYDDAVPETWTTLSSEQLGRIYNKFAQLIVAECVQACRTDDWEDPRWSKFYAGKIKRHFGVEP